MRSSLSGGLPTLGDCNRIRELDGLRGVAIGMVVIYIIFSSHDGDSPGLLFSYLTGCGASLRIGVDLFFVLSGFLIGGILLDSRPSTNYYSMFYKRRFFRFLLFTLLRSAHPVPALVSLGWVREAGRCRVARAGCGPWYAYLTFTQNFWMTHAWDSWG